MAYFSYKSNERFEKLYVSQSRPFIEVAPIGVIQHDNIGQVTTIFSVLNSSGFDAHKIGIDLKYEGGWILEWRKARTEREKKGNRMGVISGNIYAVTPEVLIPLLKPGESTEKKYNSPMGITGAAGLESVCQAEKGLPVLIRVKWENKSGHVFDEIHKYKLICTRDNENADSGSGRAFSFIPEGLIFPKSQR